MTKTIEQKFRRLTDVEHVLIRPGRYIGSVTPHTALTWVRDGVTGKIIQAEQTWNPGFLKMFDEVITNSVDHSKRPEGKRLDTIKVEINPIEGSISVWDNGGIPVVKHAEYDEYVPTLIFGYLRSGSNFDDTEEIDGAGQNGEGASLTNIFSNLFVVETADGKQKLKQTWTKNMMERTSVKLSPSSEHFTKISYIPDYNHLKMVFDIGNHLKLVKRVFDIAGCNPKLKVYLNGGRIKVASFKDYIALYTETFEYDENNDWQVGVAHSNNGFTHVSFVNSTETIQGGTHVAYVAYAIANKLREFFKKKHKVDVRPTDILNHIQLFINARIIRPRYDSQTKENLMTEVKDFLTSWEPSEKFIACILKSEIIIQVLAWVEAKELQAKMLALKGLNKDTDKLNPKRIIKLQDANLAGKEPEKCILFLTEGDSAAKAGKSTGDRDTMGFLALRGVPINVQDTDSLIRKKKNKDGKEELQENVEFKNIMMAVGLKIGEKVKSVRQLRYSMICIMTDADHDGAGHITGLIINNFYRFWPELFEMGVMHRFVTPLVKVWNKGSKNPIVFYDDHEFRAWLASVGDQNKFPMKYYKGLATSTDAEFKEYLGNINNHLIKIEIKSPEDSEVIDLVFGKTAGAADRRKVWLGLTE